MRRTTLIGALLLALSTGVQAQNLQKGNYGSLFFYSQYGLEVRERWGTVRYLLNFSKDPL